MSIRNKLIYSIICFVIIPMFFMPILTYYYSEHIIKAKIDASSQQTLAQISNSMDKVVDNAIATSNLFNLDREFIDELSNDGQVIWGKYENEKKINSKMIIALGSLLYPYNVDMTIIGFNGNVYTSSPDAYTGTYEKLSSESWFKETVNANGYVLWKAPMGNYFNCSKGSKNSIVMSRLIKWDNGSKGYGVILLSIYPDFKFGTIFTNEQQENETKLYLVSTDGTIILSYDTADIGTNIISMQYYSMLMENQKGSFISQINSQDVAINYYTFPKTGWKFVQIIPYNTLMKEIKQLWSVILTTNLFFMVVLITVAIIIPSSITKPLRKLSLLMKKLPKGDFTVRTAVKGNDEIVSLGESFNVMVLEIESLIKQIKLSSEMREKMRLEALQAQINPHFLMNTLNSIKWMSTMSGATNVGKMISALGYLLENTVGKKEEMIELSQEVKCIESYVLLQKMRYGDKLNVDYEIEDALLGYKVPCLFLQPLVENSIIHGLYETSLEGRISIKAKMENDTVVIEVNDNGKGITQKEIDRIMNDANQQTGRFNNVGIRNINERIKLIYGDQFGIKIYSELGNGTSVKVVLPLQNGGQPKDVKVVNS